LRYIDPKNSEEIASKDKLNEWIPVDFYSGGSEHTTLHLLYSRFFFKFLSDINVVSGKESYNKRLNRGLLLGPDGNKMSKSKGNVINPDPIVEKLGSDTVRMYLAFIGPYNEPGSYPWDPNGVVGVRRFLERVSKISKNNISDNTSDKVKLELNKLIKKAHDDYPELKFNTVIASMMSFINTLEKETILKDDFIRFLIILSPTAPHLSEELFEGIANNKESVFDQKIPDFDESVLSSEQKIVGIQINGKVRAEIGISDSDTEESVKEKVLNMSEINKWLEGKEIRKFIYIPGRIISIVI
jgi:leucyl-tRNA synthetase